MLWHSILFLLFALRANSSDEVDHEYVRNGLKSGRESLVSGEYIATYKLTDNAAVGVVDGSNGVYVESYVTHVRFDHRRRIFSFQSQSTIPLEDKFMERQQYIKGTEVIYELNATSPSIVSVYPLSRYHRSRTSPFPDVRALGLAFMPETRMGVSWTDVWPSYSTQKILSAVRSSETGQITVKFESPPMPRELTIDEERGFWPTKLVAYDSDNGQVSMKSTIDLVNVDGCWVPKSAKLASGTTQVSLEFDWKSVNQELPDEFFHYRQFSAKPGTKVIDYRQDPQLGILVETISVPQRGELEETKGGRNWVVVLVVSTLIIVFCGLLYWRSKFLTRA